jgi:hypothetical protein
MTPQVQRPARPAKPEVTQGAEVQPKELGKGGTAQGDTRAASHVMHACASATIVSV